MILPKSAKYVTAENFAIFDLKRAYHSQFGEVNRPQHPYFCRIRKKTLFPSVFLIKMAGRFIIAIPVPSAISPEILSVIMLQRALSIPYGTLPMVGRFIMMVPSAILPEILSVIILLPQRKLPIPERLVIAALSVILPVIL